MLPTLPVLACRRCAKAFQFRLADDSTVTVLCGPPRDVQYKAVSYVWGVYEPLGLCCETCMTTVEIPMESPEKLRRILEFVKGGSNIWLDAISIDQNDPVDLAAQMDVMGEIYQKATKVSVFLPQSDAQAYEKVKELALISDAIVKRSSELQSILPRTERGDAVSEELRVLPVNDLVDRYFGRLEALNAALPSWKYFTRAWTLQEWAMASELEISWEGADGEGIENFKNLIFEACVVAVEYVKRVALVPQVSRNDPAALTCGQTVVSESAGRHLTTAKALFPFEDFPIAEDDVEAQDLRKQAFLVTHALDRGLHVNLRNASPLIRFRMRLGLVLNVLSRSNREARYEADLVACWASMCDIRYNYDKQDSKTEALLKAIRAIRQRGLKIYNFIANTTTAEIDLQFEKYGTAHVQSNGLGKPWFLGLPILTGRADTVQHFTALLSQPLSQVCVSRTPGMSIHLQRISGAHIISTSLLSSAEALEALASTIVGGLDVSITSDVMLELQERSRSTRLKDALPNFTMLVVTVPLSVESGLESFKAWSILPNNLVSSNMFVARETLNGTLVLAKMDGPHARVLSYLTMTHQTDGTFLISTDDLGRADIVLSNELSGGEPLAGLPDMLSFHIKLAPVPGIPLELQDFTVTESGTRFLDRLFDVQLQLEVDRLEVSPVDSVSTGQM